MALEHESPTRCQCSCGIVYILQRGDSTVFCPRCERDTLKQAGAALQQRELLIEKKYSEAIQTLKAFDEVNAILRNERNELQAKVLDLEESRTHDCAALGCDRNEH